MAAVLAVSILIKIISLVMVAYTFLALSPKKEPKELGVLTKYFIVKRRYNLLRFSLLFVAALILIELVSMLRAALTAPAGVNEMQMLLSDIVFLGLIILLSRIYQLRSMFEKELKKV